MQHLGGSRYRLSTGREIDASSGGYIGISAEGRVSFGYDDAPLEIHPEIAAAHGVDYDAADLWTPEERADLADFMIAQWQQFKAGQIPRA